MGFVASKGNSAHHNWIQGNSSMQDLYLPHFIGIFEFIGLNKLFFRKRNKVYDNIFYDELPERFPEEAQEIIEKAGLSSNYQHIKDFLNV